MITNQLCIGFRVLIASLCGLCVAMGTAAAFPSDDQTKTFGPTASASLAKPDVEDLRHQIQVEGSLAVSPGSGSWVIVPRVDLFGFLTDNALQSSVSRKWDTGSVVAPGLAVTAETKRLQLRFDYSPVLSVYARTSSQNSMSHYLTANGLLTVVPELFFLDLRAIAGVQPISGGFSGINGFGVGLPQASSLDALIANSALLDRSNQSQVLTVGISPYVVHDFGDYGTVRVGSSLHASTQSSVSGFGTLPLTTASDDGQSQITVQQSARFVTGDILGRVQNTTEGMLSQTPFTASNGILRRQLGSAQASQQIITNRTAYAINHAVTVFGTVGYQNFVYNDGINQSVTGVVWDIGMTLTPNAESHITVTYGRKDGAESVAFDGKYVITPRTTISGSYSSILTTQLQNLQRELDLGALNASGVLVNNQTGAPLVIGNNGQAIQPGLFRYDVLTLTAQTRLNRDLLTLVLLSSTQRPSSSAATTTSTTTRTMSGSWVRELRSDVLLNTVVSYTVQEARNVSEKNRTFVASLGINYLMSDSLTGRLRYSYFNRQSRSVNGTSATFSRPSFGQNLISIGITKTF